LQFYRLEDLIIVNTLRGTNGLHAFGNNSAESEPIWMKYRIVYSTLFAVDQYSSNKRIDEKERETEQNNQKTNI